MHADIYMFVYGTLKRNHSAHSLLASSTYVGTGVTSTDYTLYGSENYPGLILEKNTEGVPGEIFKINDKTKTAIDKYEGIYFGLFRSALIKLTELDLLNEFKNLENKILHGIIPITGYIYEGNLNNFKKIHLWT